MSELILWLLGLQKINKPESALFVAIQMGEVEGKRPDELLNRLIACHTIEEAEKLARTSGGLRTIRALYIAIELLQAIGDKEIPTILELADQEYPYDYLVKRGNEMDGTAGAMKKIQDVMGTEEEDELLPPIDLEDEDEEEVEEDDDLDEDADEDDEDDEIDEEE